MDVPEQLPLPLGDGPWNIVIHPDALKEIPADMQGAALAEISQALLDNGLEKMLSESREIANIPADGLCPFCRTPLESIGANEWACLHVPCEPSGKWVYVADDVLVMLAKRLNDALYDDFQKNQGD